MISFVLCGQHAIVDADLATLRDVPTKRFKETVKLNLAKFPADFTVLVLDLLMPDVRGIEAAEALKSEPRTAQIPVSMVTSKQLSADDRAQFDG